MKGQKEFEKFAYGVLKEYQPKLLLTHFHIDIEARKSANYLEVDNRVPYLDPAIGYNPERVLKDWNDGKKEELKRSLIHELFHVLTDPLFNMGGDRYATKDHYNQMREHTVDHLANIIYKNNL